jgi:glycosyltransferase involved in cell wall biosynthesis
MSEDGSAELAQSHGARVIKHAPVPVVEAVRNVVADAASGDWVLALDPDERVSPGLAAELMRIRDRDDVDCVAIPILNHDLGFPATHPLHRYDPKPRFYRRDRVRWPGFPNALPEIAPDRLLRLPSEDRVVIVHDRNRTVAEAIERALRYAPAQAQAMVDEGQFFRAKDMLRALGGKTYKQFVVGQPWKDGVPGFLRAGILVAFHFYVWAAFWQFSGAQRNAEDDLVMSRLGHMIEAVRLPGRVARRGLRAVRSVARPSVTRDR